MKKNNKEISQRKQKRYLKNKTRLNNKPQYSKFERQQEFIKQSLRTGVYNAFAEKENNNG